MLTRIFLLVTFVFALFASPGQAQAQQQLTNFLNYGSGYQPGSAQMFH